MSARWRLPLSSYRGLPMRCAPGTHEAAAALLLKHVAARPAVLDLASGSGAFLARLADQGFTDLAAVEIDRAGFRLPNIEPLHVDLNGPFAAQLPRRYGLITAIEILEHLDSPRHFLREIHAALDDDGYLLLSTPNVANWTGRLRFLLSGEHRQFQAHDYDYQRHISPTTDTQLRLTFREVGFRVIDATVAGTFFGPLKRAALAPVIAAARLLWGNAGTHDVRIYLAQRTAADTSSTGSNSFYFEKTAAGKD